MSFQCLIVCGQSTLRLQGGVIHLSSGSSTIPVFLFVNNDNPDAILRDSGHIVSEGEFNFVKRSLDTSKSEIIFPFGLITGEYIPISHTISDTASQNLAISTWSTNSVNNPLPEDASPIAGPSAAIDRFWNIMASDSHGGQYTLSYLGSENTTTNPTTSLFSPQYWDGTSWTSSSNGSDLGIATGVGSVTSSFSISDGQYPIVLSQNSPVPIELIAFTAKWTNESKMHSVLQWVTASERNNSHFDIERSTDGVSFYKIGSQKGAGNSNSKKQYEYDDDLSYEINNVFYYRLKQIDFDLHYEYTKVCRIERNRNREIVILYPNPFESSITLETSNFSGISTLEISDLSGRILKTIAIDSEYVNKTKIPLSNLQYGTYYLTITNDNYKKTYPIIKY
ncbi:MAG: T9SS type A sorting domain-containing protein [Bacteroidia bacterium]